MKTRGEFKQALGWLLIGGAAFGLACIKARADETVSGKLTVDQPANSTAFQVLGGTSGAPLALFQRNDGNDVQINIHGAGSDPQITLSDLQTGDSAGLWTIGVKKSDDSFRIVNASNLVAQTNEYFTILESGNVGIGTTAPPSRLYISNPGTGGGGDVALGQHFVIAALAPNIKLIDLSASTDAYYIHLNQNVFKVGRAAGSAIENDLVLKQGNVGIGTATPSEKLAVNGTIRAKEVIVETSGWSDYVFDDGYELPPLGDVEAHIKSEGHLPGIPSAQEAMKQGVAVGDMQAKLLAKVEEMTLYMIRLEKENAELRQRVERLERTP